ncbi:L-threonylcarbamoyladenylate synthase [Tepidiforma sp.]|uniref:L-threonylcarbamoyladenylate synthase n=1 Tax=Tepidiforma sp. TaxID=2682230 RepID=UPI002ADD5EF5|nr:L-threonylcarbamoyladenylate synthase [Tepidiforma sp.]
MTDSSPGGLVAAAVSALQAGDLVILPTDTVYGIAADVRNDDAVRAIYRAKQRDPGQPLQLLFGRQSVLLEQYAVLTPAAMRLVETLGPGAWTVIVPRRPGWDSPALSGGNTVGFRVVPVDLVLDIIDALGAPLAATSANVSGGPSPTTADEARRQVGAFCSVVIDGGPTAHGLDSTVIDLSGAEPEILREGAIPADTVARILGLATIPVRRSVRQ